MLNVQGTRLSSKKGQVTLFIILALLIVGGMVAYFTLRDSPAESLSVDLQPVYDYYRSCLEDTASGGIALMGQQAGYIDVPEFVPGSQFMPFSSQLDFLGQPIPYWLYVSGNNILREQVPTISGMQDELSAYVAERLDLCDFSDFQSQGYDIFVESGTVETQISEGQVEFSVSNKISIFLGNQSAQVFDHDIIVLSKLGKFYDTAKQIYEAEKTETFLEYYALDVMRLYAPVTGVEIDCAPKVFVEENIKQDIASGLASNIPSVKVGGDYYDLSAKERDYYVAGNNLNVGENVHFLYLPSWPTTIDVHGDLIVEPVGLQEGLGILGFCYVPYHFVYDINFPVLVQIFDQEEFFQFPLAVVIAKNQPRSPLQSVAGSSFESPICEHANQDLKVNTFDLDVNPVEANIKFTCLDSSCSLGQTQITSGGALLETQVPRCVNGFIEASAEGYASSRYQISTNEETSANILLSKKHKIPVDLGNVKQALVSFSGEDYSATMVYPEMNEIELVEGFYNVTVYLYENSTLRFPEVNERRCVDVPESGLTGFFGVTTEKCFDINIPSTEVSFAVVGGGQAQTYVLEGELATATELNINVPLFAVPNSLEELQANHVRVETELVRLSFE